MATFLGEGNSDIKPMVLVVVLVVILMKRCSHWLFPEGVEICVWHAHGGLSAWGGKPQSLGLYGYFPRRRSTLI